MLATPPLSRGKDNGVGRRWSRGSGWPARLAGTIVCGALSVCIASALAAERGTSIPGMLPEPPRGRGPSTRQPGASLSSFRVFLSLVPVRQRVDRERLARLRHQVGVTTGCQARWFRLCTAQHQGTPFTWAATTTSNPAASLLTLVISAVKWSQPKVGRGDGAEGKGRGKEIR